MTTWSRGSARCSALRAADVRSAGAVLDPAHAPRCAEPVQDLSASLKRTRTPVPRTQLCFYSMDLLGLDISKSCATMTRGRTWHRFRHARPVARSGLPLRLMPRNAQDAPESP